MFTSKRDPSVFGFSNNRKGLGLPTTLGPWEGLGRRAMSGNTGIDTAVEVRAAIKAEGYFLARSGEDAAAAIG